MCFHVMASQSCELLEKEEGTMAGYRDKYFENNPSNHGWYECEHCHKSYRKNKMDVDHIIPQSKGGGDSEWNLQGLCQHCNRSKKDNMHDTIPDLIRNGSHIAEREIKNSPFGKLFGKKK